MLSSRTLLVFGAVAGLQALLASAAFPHVRRADAACNAGESLGAVDPHWDDKLNRCVFWDCKPDYVMVDNWSVPFTDDKRRQITADKSTMELIRCTKGTKDDCGATHYVCTDPDPAHLSYCARKYILSPPRLHPHLQEHFADFPTRFAGDISTKTLEKPNQGALICVQCGSGLGDASTPQNTRMCA